MFSAWDNEDLSKPMFNFGFQGQFHKGQMIWIQKIVFITSKCLNGH